MSAVLDTLIPIWAVIALGWFLAGRPGFSPEPLARLAISVSAPALIFTLFLATDLSNDQLPLLALGAGLVVLLTLAAGRAALPLMLTPHRGLLLPVAFWNAGNMGLSVVRLHLGEQALPLAAVVFVTVASLQAVLGTAIAKGSGGVRAALSMPLVHASLAGLTCTLSGWTPPAMLTEPVAMVGELAIPLMLLTLGMSLRRLRISHLRDAALIVGLRSGLGLAAALLVVSVLNLQGVPRQVLLIEACLPPAVINVLFARRFNAAPEAVASAIVLGTAASLLILPLVLWAFA
ncbi:MAG: hypothetical protein DRQ55_12895 [Planctomycetota bacterium]|nr:MAG: hypothetical protein DRQ55_12895 [Planctomycetota bacterium]